MKKMYSRNFIATLFTAMLILLTYVASAQTLATDLPDYPPGSTVIITGTGFLAGETVVVQVLHDGEDGDDDSSDAHDPWDVIADEDGNISTTWWVPADQDEGDAALIAIATGQTSAAYAEVHFTDAICPPITITSNPVNTLTCGGQSVTFNVSATSTAPGALTYKWRKNSVIITGATTTSFTIASVTAGDAGNYDVIVTNTCGTTKVSTVGTLSLNNVDGGAIGTNQTIHIGGYPSALASLVNGSGAGTITYQWEVSTNNISWASIAGATDASYNPSALFQDAYYHRITTSTLNGVSCTAVSNLVLVVVNNVTAGSISSSNQTINSGDAAATITSTSAATADGSLAYQWQESIDGGATWTDISGATNANYSPGSLTQTTRFRRRATSTLAGITDQATSNEMTVTVNTCSAVASSFNATACDSYTLAWGGTVNTSGNYSHTYATAIGGCDSVVTAHVTINNSAATSLNAAACNSYTLPWGTAVNATGNYSHLYNTVHGCDSTVTVHVTINSSPSVSASVQSQVNQGGSISLTSSGGASYSWSGPNGFTSNAQNPTISNAAVAAGGTYTVIATSAAGCTASANASVTVIPTPPATASSNSPASEGGTINLSAGNGAEYLWEGPNGFTSTEQNPTIDNANSENSGTYTVTITDAYGYTYVYSTDVVVQPSGASGNGVVNEDGTITLSAGSGESYAWTGPNAFTSTEQNVIISNASGENAGTYTVVVTDAFGNTYTSSVDVVIHPSPASSNSPADQGGTIVLTAGSGEEYAWEGPNGFTGSEKTVEISAATPSNSGTYSVTVTDVFGNTYVSSTDVVIYETPIATGSNPVCQGGTINLGASGGDSYAWHGPNGFTSASQNPSIATAALANGGTYTVTVTRSDGSTKAATTSVVVNATYNVSGTSAVSCNSYTLPWNQTVTTSGNYAHTYSSLSGCDSIVTIHVTINSAASSSYNASACNSYALPWGGSASSSGNYSHTYSTVNGCDSVVTAHVTINHSAASSFNATSCNSYALPWGGSASLSGNYSHTYSTVNGCDSVVTAHVTINNSASSSFNATSCGNYTLPWGGSVSSSGNYSHTYSTVNGCDSVVTAHVTISGYPSASASGATACAGGTLNLSSSGGTSYSWSGPNGFASTSQNPSISNATSAKAGTYTVTVSNASGCTATATASATVNVPSASASSSPACVGRTLSLSANSGSSYSWTGPNSFTSSLQNPSISNVTSAAAGTYSVSVTDGNGCVASASTSVSVYSAPTATASSNNPVAGGTTLNLTSSGGSTYSWAGPNSFTSTLQNPSIASVTWQAAGTYTVTVTNASGCTAAATKTVTVNCAGFKSYTYTQGGWGAAPAGNNPAVYRNANFPYAFPNGISVGYGTNWLNLTTSQAVQDFLPSGGSPNSLSTSYTNPGGSLSNTLAGQVVALACNVGFDNYDATFAPNTPLKLKDLFVKTGTFQGWTVQQLFDEAQKKLGGGTSSYSASQLCNACASINQNYDNGTTDAGFLSCIPVRVTNPVDDTPEQVNLKVYPNPSNGIFMIEVNFFDGNDNSVDIQILNMLGQVVYQDRTTAFDGQLKQEVKFGDNLTSGNYFVRVTSGDQIFDEQIIYQR